MDETAGRADKLVLVFSDEAMGRDVAEELSLASASLSHSLPFAGARVGSHVVCLPSLDELVAALMASAAWTLVIDPAHAFRIAGAIPALLPRLRETSALLRRVLLFADSTESSLRGTCAIASGVQCTLLVRGVDEAQLAREVFGPLPVGPGVQRMIEQVVPQMTGLPRRVRERWEGALMAPDDSTVKGIAADSDVSRRTMERWFARCGLPAPGSLLKMFEAAHAPDRESTSPGAGKARMSRGDENRGNAPEGESRDRKP